MLLTLSLLACVEMPVGPSADGAAVANPPAPSGQRAPDVFEQTCPDSIDVMLAVDPACDPVVLADLLPALMDAWHGSETPTRLLVLDVGANSTAPVAVVTDPTADPTSVLDALQTVAFDPLAGRPALLDRVLVALDDPTVPAPDADLAVIGWLQTPDDSLVADAEFEGYLGADRSQTLTVLGPPDVQDDLRAVAEGTGGGVADPTAGALTEAGVATVRSLRELPLSDVPIPETIEVVVRTPDGTELLFRDPDFTLDSARNSVRFVEFVPSCGDRLEVSYSVAP